MLSATLILFFETISKNKSNGSIFQIKDNCQKTPFTLIKSLFMMKQFKQFTNIFV